MDEGGELRDLAGGCAWLAGFLFLLFLAGMALAAIFPPPGW